ncbi:MAG: hypothetical protein Q8784_02095 [Vigna little leaf phytoplasma]|nr:hypothetical protein [Vigna little leaf phytoplasma]
MKFKLIWRNIKKIKKNLISIFNFNLIILVCFFIYKNFYVKQKKICFYKKFPEYKLTSIQKQQIPSYLEQRQINGDRKYYNSKSKKIIGQRLKDGTLILYDYQSNKNTIKIIYPNEETYFYKYINNKLHQIILPNNDLYEYDIYTGNLIKKILANGRIEEYSRNINLRLIRKIFPSGICWEYDIKTGQKIKKYNLNDNKKKWYHKISKFFCISKNKSKIHK